jgi:hypothetical protein
VTDSTSLPETGRNYPPVDERLVPFTVRVSAPERLDRALLRALEFAALEREAEQHVGDLYPVGCVELEIDQPRPPAHMAPVAREQREGLRLVALVALRGHLGQPLRFPDGYRGEPLDLEGELLVPGVAPPSPSTCEARDQALEREFGRQALDRDAWVELALARLRAFPRRLRPRRSRCSRRFFLDLARLFLLMGVLTRAGSWRRRKHPEFRRGAAERGMEGSPRRR